MVCQAVFLNFKVMLYFEIFKCHSAATPLTLIHVRSCDRLFNYRALNNRVETVEQIVALFYIHR